MGQFNSPPTPPAPEQPDRSQLVTLAPRLTETVDDHWATLCLIAGDGNVEEEGIPALLSVVVDLFRDSSYYSPQTGIPVANELRLIEAALGYLSRDEVKRDVALSMIKIVLDAPVTLNHAADCLAQRDFKWELSDPELITGVQKARKCTDGASFLQEDIIEGIRSHSRWIVEGGQHVDLYQNVTYLRSLVEPLGKLKDALEAM